MNLYIILYNSYDIIINKYIYIYILKVMVIFVALSPGNPETAGAKPRLDDVAYRETLPGLIEKNGGTISVYQCLLKFIG